MNILCWWFGCDGLIERTHYVDNIDFPPNCEIIKHCSRCGNETDYADLVGDTRYSKFKSCANHWLLRRWYPRKCWDCGKRYGNHNNCLPF